MCEMALEGVIILWLTCGIGVMAYAGSRAVIASATLLINAPGKY
jgi:hypothetical protein